MSQNKITPPSQSSQRQPKPAALEFDSGSRISVRTRVFSIFAGSVGNLVEWYDWYVYSAFSLYFAHIFFPNGDLKAQLLNSAAVFAGGFLMRPLGGWLMGWYADRKGRKASLMLSVTMMSFGSLLIAFAPTSTQVGVLSPIILIFARLIQGLSVGGEYGTSATYLSEMATAKHRGFYSSFQYVTLIMGQLAALLTLILLQRFFLTTEQLEDWGWRIPFLIGAGLSVLVYALRAHMHETESFQKQSLELDGMQADGNPLRELLRYPREVLTVVGLTMGGTVAFYTYTTYMQKFLVTSAGMAKDRATLISTGALMIFMCLQPLVGWISDQIGRKPVLLSFGIFGTIFTYPILNLIRESHSEVRSFILILSALVIVSGYTAINAVVKAELFPVNIRAVGVGLPYAISVSFFGGTAEYLALWTKDAGHESWYFWYVTGCIVCSFLVYSFMRDTQKNSKIL